MSYFFIAILCFIVFIGAVILPWVNMTRLNNMGRELDVLYTWMAQQKRAAGDGAPVPPQPRPPGAGELEPLSAPKPEKKKDADEVDDIPPASDLPPAPEPLPQPALQRVAAKREKPKRKMSFEQQFGERLPVWIGGIAIALGGLYLVKYSIENELLGPGMRVTLGVLLGAALLVVARFIFKRKSTSNSVRIAQSLAGAGIAVLYLSIYAATSLYGLLHHVAGFGGMAGVTGLAVVLSLRYGPPIALMGMVGGFLTPALIGSPNPSAPALFCYLYFVFAGLMIIMKRQNWWLLALPVLLLAFLWVFAWTFWLGHFHADDGFWIVMFLVAVCATMVWMLRDDEPRAKAATPDGDGMFARIKHGYMPTARDALNIIGVGGSILLLALVAGRSGFGLPEWGMFWLLAAGGMGLIWFKPVQYGFVPWLTLFTSAAMLLFWGDSDPSEFSSVLLCFAIVHLSGYALAWRSVAPVLWSGVAATASVLYYLLAYGRLEDMGYMPGGSMSWGFLALALSALATGALMRAGEMFRDDEATLRRLQGIFAFAATALLSIALAVVLERDWLSVAIAAEIMGVAWVNNRLRIPVFRTIAGLLLLVFAFLMGQQIALLIELTVYSLFETRLPTIRGGIPMVDWPLFQLGFPAALFVAAAYFLSREAETRLVRVLEYAAVALTALMGFYLVRHAFHPGEEILLTQAGFMERGANTNGIFVFGLACLWLGKRYGRLAVTRSGLALAGVAIFRVVWFDMLMHNPAWNAGQEVGDWPLLNGLLLPFGLTLAWCAVLMQELRRLERPKLVRVTGVFAMLCVFALVTLQVRQAFHGTELAIGAVSNAEMYSYSAAWLALGFALLAGGVMRGDRMLRLASLGVITLTVGKVFLFDSSELEGLYRIFSFFGLGLCLIGLSWLYTRYVFRDAPETAEKAD